MRSAAFGWCVFSLLLSLPLFAQTDASQKIIKSTTGGSCSPIVNGGSSQITINCNGLSAAKANQLVTLMNRILSERLDLSEVNSKLDQLQSALGDINDTMVNAMDPFAKAPPAVIALLKQGDLLTTRCRSFGSDWSEKIAAVSDQSIRDMRANRAAAASLPPANAASPIAQQKGGEFASTYGPKLVAMNAKFHALVPDARPIKDIGVPGSVLEASSYNLAIYSLSQTYVRHQSETGRPVDTRLAMEERRLWQDVLDFLGTWNNEAIAGLNSPRPSRPRTEYSLNLESAKDAVDAREVQTYRQTLEPQLVSYRDAVLPHVPDYANGKDYDAVRTTMQLMGVCSDVGSLRGAYLTQAAADLKQASSRKKP